MMSFGEYTIRPMTVLPRRGHATDVARGSVKTVFSVVQLSPFYFEGRGFDGRESAISVQIRRSIP